MRRKDSAAVPSPHELGLPFGTWRPFQPETIHEAYFSLTLRDDAMFLVQGPTGFGRSAVGLALPRFAGWNAIVTVATKNLQEQYQDSFPGLPIIMGRGNYPCKLHGERSGLTAEYCVNLMRRRRLPDPLEGEEDSQRCPLTDRCEYYLAKERALHSQIAVLNLQYFLNEANYAGEFSGRDLLVLDEVDMVEDEVMSFVGLEISWRRLQDLSLPSPPKNDSFRSWRAWALDVLRRVSAEVDDLEEEAKQELREDRCSRWARQLLKRWNTLKALERKLKFFVTNVDEGWVLYQPEELGEEKWVFKPVLVADFVRRKVLRHGRKVMGMSATIIDRSQLLRNMGVPRGMPVGHIDIPSAFPPEKRPLFYIPRANLSRRTEEDEFPKLVEAVKEVLPKYEGRNVLVHTVSWKRNERLCQALQNLRVLTHSKGDQQKAVGRFKAERGLFLLSPSLVRGADFPYDECRCIVICKTPFPDLGDKQVERRVKGFPDGRRWLDFHTARALIQMTGRGMRAEDDWCHSYIFDHQFERFLARCRSLFPGYWLDAIVRR